jgi:hypothetical protein
MSLRSPPEHENADLRHAGLVPKVSRPDYSWSGGNLRHSVQAEGASLEESGHESRQMRRLVHFRRDLRFARWLPY